MTIPARLLFLLSALFASAGTTGPAKQMTLGDLGAMCASRDPSTIAACQFYVLGAFEGLDVGNATAPPASGRGPYTERQGGKAFCVPDDLPSTVMRDQVLGMAALDLKRFPEDAKMPAISFIGAVITKAYACP